jgi:hypothetical protein
MKKLVLLVAPVLVAVGAFFIYQEKFSSPSGVDQAIEYRDEEEEGGDEKFKAQKERYEHDVMMTLDPALGFVPNERLINAEDQARQMRLAGRANNLSAVVWAERGPNNMGGRTRSIIIDRNDATGNTVLAGSVSGGLWRTTNFKSATPTWTQIPSVSANLAITAMAQDPSNFNIMYAGTGEGYNNIDAVRGLGIYKSTDGGNTWSLLASTTTGGTNANDFSYVQKILVYSNGDVYAAAISAIFCNNGGVLKSTNGGTSWTRVIGNYTGGGTCNNAFDFRGFDLDMAANGDIYATVIDNGSSFVAPATMDTTRGKIYRSPAGATVGNTGTWVNVTPPAPAAANSYWARIEVATSPTNASKLYAILEGTASNVGAIMVSTNSGTNWTDVTNTNNWCDQGSSSSRDFSRGQAWYDLFIAIKPDDDQTVFVGGVDIMKTTNGGTNWVQNTQWNTGCGTLPTVHADHHNLVYFPGSTTEFINVNDGGIYYSNDNGATYSNKSAGYNTIQYYYGAIHPTAGSNYMLAGAQDNGTHKFSTIGLGPVTTATGGDGGFCFIDQNNPLVQVTAYTGSQYSISRDGGASFPFGAFYTGGRFINPTDYDNVANLLYCGSTAGRIRRIENIQSGTIAAFSETITTTSYALSAVKVDPLTANRVWMGFSTNPGSASQIPQLYYMDNSQDYNTNTITQITLPAAFTAGTYISSIDVDPADGNRLLLALSNYGVQSVWESTNLGASWTSLDANGVNLPDMPVRWAMFVPANATFDGTAIRGIMLATELGIWTTTQPNGTTTSWVQSAGVPNVRVDALRYRTSDRTVMAATHGRGVFTSQLPTVLPITLLNFNGKLDQKSALLDWTTSSETNSRSFDIEKSTDGSNFYKIGSVDAAGNSTTERTYSFRDNRISSVNYYRLRMNDIDGKNKLSGVVVVRYNAATQNMWVVNNPFKNHIDLRFARKAQTVKLQLVSMSGAVVEEKTFTNPSDQTRWTLSRSVSTGSYILRATIDNEVFTSKLVRE